MPVHTAAAAGNLDAIRLCVTSDSINPNQADSHRWTTLHCAIADGYLDVVEFLIDQSVYDTRFAWTRDGRKTLFDT
ncbi:putative Ankyrin repeat domain-containing protein EMB506, chloroplastic [Cocos nucifera]|uniref:Putative Ankyrin repeat domain-containing protein EMB506, chloroplastic n=1 Tax=Cocos nucifera TaxID=13894 RepID=A0A8K0N5N4_COCNU|nr:putative Ankyrin repeat domain-containing protein EMB506, chloroplastic [Cocos nucifera]